MPKIIRPLTDAEVRGAKAIKRDFSLFDGGGLLLYVKVAGSKTWRFRYYQPYTRKRQTLTLGTYPETRLPEARRLKEEARLQISRGIDPNEVKREKERESNEEFSNTVGRVAHDWMELRRSDDLGAGTIQHLSGTVKNHIVALFGKVPVNKLTPRMVISAMQPMKAAGHLVQLEHVVQVLNRIMNFSVNTGLVSFNPLAKVSAAFPSPTKSNLPTIQRNELPELLSDIKNVSAEPVIHAAIDWLMLTMTRPIETIGARWDEINIEDKTWVIPPERMKMKKMHIVPLCQQALNILDFVKPFSGGDGYIFQSPIHPNKHLARGTINKIFYKTKFKGRMVPHGFRSLASTTLNEQGFNPDVIEAALAHGSGNSIRDIYNRSTYLEQRRVMMCWWGDFIESARQGNVMNIDATNGLRLVQR
ncbi:tyrosine-type recombinase/integrase [Yersinia pseudotuberculosis]|uniref:tyrosine-type recombinase/integrase n=1 Tax=Yersinia pseudotuberculosis TaxID=633 RepID=UPI0038B64C43